MRLVILVSYLPPPLQRPLAALIMMHRCPGRPRFAWERQTIERCALSPYQLHTFARGGVLSVH